MSGDGDGAPFTQACVVVRPAGHADAAGIARIYNQGIEERVATFETEPRSASDISAALERRGPRHPTLVVETDGRVASVAWLSEYRARACYEGIAEFSVYSDRDFRGLGLGRTVMEALNTRAAERGFWKLVGRVFPENTASRKLCHSLGFREVGTYERHGKLDGQWRDCVIVERLIGEATN